MAIPRKTWLPWVILLVGLGGGLPLAWHIKEEYRTKSDEELIVEAWEEYRDAVIDRDFEAVWWSMTDHVRDSVHSRLRWVRGLDPDFEADAEFLAKIESELGLTWEDLQEIEAIDLFVRTSSIRCWTHFRDWVDTCDVLDDVALDIWIFGEGRAYVRFSLEDEWLLTASFHKQGERWFISEGIDSPERFAEREAMLTLSRKVANNLPRGDMDLERITLVYEADAGEPGDAALAALRREVEALGIPDLEEASIVLEIPPDVSWGGVLRYCDVLWSMEVGTVLFAQTAGPPREKYVEEDIQPDIIEEFDNPDDRSWLRAKWPEGAIRHAAIPRIIGMPMVQAHWLERNLELFGE